MTHEPSFSYLTGFGAHHQTEAISGALPADRNSPRNVPFGLYGEQINGTSFTVPRANNQRAWTYRIRPTCTESPYSPDGPSDFSAEYLESPPALNLLGWTPLPPDLPRPHDFLDGLNTFGGAGDPVNQSGCAIHLYIANKSMERTAIKDVDGDLMFLPDTGRLVVKTEMGRLSVEPGQILVVPRGIVFSIELVDPVVRGYVGEVYGRHFALPERSVIGANGLADERHFEYPTAWYEEDDEPWTIVCKLGGDLYRSIRPGSPFDVVAWHGNYAPYRYDLSHFCPVGAVSFDHPDPSIFTVLSAPLDRPGENALDLVIFPPRYDVAQDTFRPPFHHRNAASELNGIVTGHSKDSVFSRGGYFLTPPMTGHGIEAASLERHLSMKDEAANSIQRISDASTWFQFESTLPLRVSPWALGSPNRVHDFGAGPRATPKRFKLD